MGLPERWQEDSLRSLRQGAPNSQSLRPYSGMDSSCWGAVVRARCFRRTLRITDPAPVAVDINPRRCRRVRWSRQVRHGRHAEALDEPRGIPERAPFWSNDTISSGSITDHESSSATTTIRRGPSATKSGCGTGSERPSASRIENGSNGSRCSASRIPWISMRQDQYHSATRGATRLSRRQVMNIRSDVIICITV